MILQTLMSSFKAGEISSLYYATELENDCR